MNQHFTATERNNQRHQNVNTVIHNAKHARNAQAVLNSIIIAVLHSVVTPSNEIRWNMFTYFENITYGDILWPVKSYFVEVSTVITVVFGFRGKSLCLGYTRMVEKILPF